MKYKCRDIEAALKKKGFVEIRNGDHKKYYYSSDAGKVPIRTVTSHNNPEYDDYLLSKMVKQLFLSPDQFRNLVECPLSKEELAEIYRVKLENMIN